jgi:DNA repair exonuclease SbcCD nuclease subunit
MIRFIHTADWQIGKPFAGIEDDHKRALVQQQRIATLSHISTAAHERKADFILVAGDLFDSPTPTQAMVSATCAAIGAMGVPVYTIPGNHDHGGPGSLWEQPFFQREQSHLAPNLHVLRAPEPIELEQAIIFPCPLLRRSESNDTTAWLRDPGALEKAGGKARIVLAHGSVQGFGQSSDEDELAIATNQIDLSRLPNAGLDYIALGDWHGMKEISVGAWYAGTPEIDRFPKGDGNKPGNILAVTAERGKEALIEVVPTTRFGWHRLERELSEDSAVGSLRSEIEAIVGQRAQEDLLRLDISGTLGIQATIELESLIETFEARLLRLKLTNRTVLAPNDAEIEELTSRSGDPVIASVARQLVDKATKGDEIAQIAIRELHANCLNRGL